MALLMVWGGVAHAADEVHCKTIDGGAPRLEEIDARVRLSYLSDGLARDAFRARAWAWSWAGIYSALTVGNGILALTTSSKDDSTDDWIGAAASFVGVAVLVILPLKVMHDQRWMARRMRNARPDEDPCALLADAERLLIRDAASEEFGTGPLVHAGNFAFNIGVTLLMGIGFNHWTHGIITGTVGIVVGEIQAFTQPMGSVKLLNNYRVGALGLQTPPPTKAWMLVPTVSRDHYGLSFSLSF